MYTRPKKTVQEKAQEVAMMEVFAGDYLRTMKLDNDPVACRKYLADVAARDVGKYRMMNTKYRGLEAKLNSPITPMNKCLFCESKPDEGEKLLRCSSCKAVRYCNRDCQSKDWKFHKKGCALIQKAIQMGDKMIEDVSMEQSTSQKL